MFGPGGPTFLELAEQALSSTDRGYDLLARKFDRTPFRTPDALLDEVAPFVGPVRRAVDLGCGTGAGLRMLRPLAADLVVGLDRSAGMLAEASRHAPEWPGDARVALVRGDALEAPFEGAFDVAVCFGAFGHIRVEDEPRFARAVYRALRPGGRFVFVTGRTPPWSSPGRWAAEGFNAAMRLRNAVIRPPFVMYYLTFVLPGVRGTLEAAGFEVDVREGVLSPPFARGAVVIASRPA